MNSCSRNAAFTLVEVLVVIAILGMIVGLAIPFYQSFQSDSEVDNRTAEIVQALRHAQVRAMASEALSAWGVYFATHEYVTFRGAVYSPADPMNERVEVDQPLSITTGAGSAVVFSPVAGTATGAGAIVIESSTGASRTITINGIGVVDAP
ncbi:MAG: type II secretion system protein [Patescibacteria group bacterium]|nr:type II secretion system protein [Patescibacteria group bacterium]MDD5715626.1 type II secretion system protein [Patescibacteria group bacterium]